MVIDADLNSINCLTSSNDGEGVWGLVDKHLYSIEHGRQDDVFGRRVSFRHQRPLEPVRYDLRRLLLLPD